ncbi:MAG: cupredoxin domain-containing protein [Deltaproteobacteria bacterium]|nr:cupredoxin domain-containing protein [Deltaproteobacteria bacterium]
MKRIRPFVLSITAIAAVFAAWEAFAGPSQTLRKDFINALEANDGEKMFSIVEANKDNVPGEIQGLLAEAKETKENKAGFFHIAEMMARNYKDITGNTALLIEVRKTDFESRLNPPLRTTAVNGAHTVDVPKATANAKNVFMPDNIIIKKGETVRWVNNDETAHIFSSMPLIGKKGIKSPSVDPGKSHDFKLEEAGEYYYICFIHRGMIGKITVEE